MRRYTVNVFFNFFCHISVECDDFIINDGVCYTAIRDGLRVMTIPFTNVKYTTLIENSNDISE